MKMNLKECRVAFISLFSTALLLVVAIALV